MKSLSLRKFRGPARRLDPTDADVGTLHTARNLMLFPQGGFSVVPTPKRLWELPPLSSLKASLDLTAADRCVLLRIANEGHAVLAWYDCVADQFRGFEYAGADVEESLPESIPSLTVGEYRIEVLARGFEPTPRWTTERYLDSVVAGNGLDDNLIYSPGTFSGTPELRRMGLHLRPIKPSAVAQDLIETTPHDATFIWNNVLFTALQFDFAPVAEENYRREDGNHVRLSVVQGSEAGRFSSKLEGKGTQAEPWHYTVFCPYPSRELLLEFPFSEVGDWVATDDWLLDHNGAPIRDQDDSPISTQSTSPTLTVSGGSLQLADGKGAILEDGLADLVGETVEITAQFNAYGAGTLKVTTGETQAAWFPVSAAGTHSATLTVPVLGPNITVFADGAQMDIQGILLHGQMEGRASESELVNFIRHQDSRAENIINALLIGDDDDVSYFHDAELSGGRTSFDANDTFVAPNIDVAMTYFRRGRNDSGLGQESAPCPIVTVENVATKRLRVTVTKDESNDEASRYDSIRIYLSQYDIETTNVGWTADVATGVYNYDPGQQVPTNGFATQGHRAFKLAMEVPNESGTYLIAPSLIDENHVLRQALPLPPCTEFQFIFDRIFFAGDPDHPMRLGWTREATADERLPETTAPGEYIDLPARGPDDKITALAEFRGYLIISTRYTSFYRTPNGTMRGSSIHSGILNGRATAIWENSQLFYVGADGNLYRMELPDGGSQDNDMPVSNQVLPYLGDYLADFFDLSRPDQFHSQVDYVFGQWWIWGPGKSGAYKSVIYDFRQNELSGPNDAPALSASSRIKNDDPRFLGCDHANLAWITLKPERDQYGRLENISGLTYHESDAALPDGFATPGGRMVAVTPSGQRIVDGVEVFWLTAAVDHGEENRMMYLQGVSATFTKGSAGYLIVRCISDQETEPQDFEYGEIFDATDERIYQPVTCAGNHIQIALIVLCGEGKPCECRAVRLHYREPKSR